MEKSKLHQRALLFFGIIFLTSGLLLAGCQAEQPLPPTPSLENLSPEKQGYVERGLIELVPDSMPLVIIPANPSQADLGEDPYYQICMSCHGNWGQGLTDEWREIGFKEDMNCWQSKCHASNHPPEGFEFPKIVPPILGRNAMLGIANAQQLYDVIYETMPWWDPHSLSAEESLNLTAYIMRARGELPEGVVLTQTNMAAFTLHTEAPTIIDERPLAVTMVIGFGVALLAYAWMTQIPNKQERDQG